MAENKDISGIKTTLTSTDPETGSMSWDVKYEPDFETTYKHFRKLVKEFKKFTDFVEVKQDPKLMEIARILNSLYDKFRSHLRKTYPKKYSVLKSLDENKIREIVRNGLKEMSSTGAGAEAAHFEPGEGAQYATPNAFNPDKKAKGAKNIYYYKLGWKPVDAKKLHKQAKGIEHKDLWKTKLEEKETTDSYINSLNLPDGDLKTFITDRIKDYDDIEQKLNILLPLLKQAKTKTEKAYRERPDFTTAKDLPGAEFGKEQLDSMIKNVNNLLTLFNKK